MTSTGLQKGLQVLKTKINKYCCNIAYPVSTTSRDNIHDQACKISYSKRIFIFMTYTGIWLIIIERETNSGKKSVLANIIDDALVNGYTTTQAKRRARCSAIFCSHNPSFELPTYPSPSNRRSVDHGSWLGKKRRPRTMDTKINIFLKRSCGTILASLDRSALHLSENTGAYPLEKKDWSTNLQSQCMWQFQAQISTGCENYAFENSTDQRLLESGYKITVGMLFTSPKTWLSSWKEKRASRLSHNGQTTKNQPSLFP